MYTDPRFFPPNGPPTHVCERGDNKNEIPLGGHYASTVPTATIVGTSLAGTDYGIPNPLGGFEFQPLEMCPKNFIIFDQTNHASRVMFHPASVHKFGTQNVEIFNAHAVEAHKSVGRNGSQNEYETSLKEDTDDIDALLSSGEELEEEDEDDDLVSTGRTPGDSSRYGFTIASYSIKDLKSHGENVLCHKSVSSNTGSTKRKKDKMKNLVQALRNIIPGGTELDASAFLDEAVEYLKSVKVEVEELGVHNFDDF